MSEIDRSEAFKRNAQKLDLQALADAFEAKGDHEQARQLREQAQKQQQVSKNSPGEQRKAERLDVEALADALQQQGKQEDAKYFHKLAQKQARNKQQKLSQRQGKPPETK